MSDLLERIKLSKYPSSVWLGKANGQEIIDLIEQQQARIAELEQHEQELAVTVDVLREYLRSLVEESTGVIGWHLNGAVADWDEVGATDILGETNDANLNAVKRDASIEGFMFSGQGFNGELYNDGWPKVVELFDTELQIKYQSGEE